MIIDFCMPFWGDPDDMRAAVDSVRSQSDGNWRLTVIDDCYPDDSVEAFFAGIDDPRISYIRNDRNIGITENFRRAVASAQGPYVIVLGSDDIVGTEYVSTMRQLIDQHPDVDVFQVGVSVIDSNGDPTRTLTDTVKRVLTPRRARTFRGEEMATTLLTGNWLYWPSLMFRTQTIRDIDFRDDLPIILDLALLIDIAFRGGALHFHPGSHFNYRRHAASLSQKTLLDGTRFDDELDFYRSSAATARQMRWKRAERAARMRLMSRLHGLTTFVSLVVNGNARARSAAFRLAFTR